MNTTLRALLFTLLFFFSYKGFAHADFWVTRSYGKVTVRVMTGWEQESIQKALIAGQLTDSLTRMMAYEDSILLDFIDLYMEQQPSTYLLGYHKGWAYGPRDSQRPFFASDNLIFEECGPNFCIENTLKLVEYAIEHCERVIHQQSEAFAYGDYYKPPGYSLPQSTIDDIIRKPTSGLLSQVFKTKVERPVFSHFYAEAKVSNYFSYYYQDLGFHVYNKKDPEQKPITVLDNIYSWQPDYVSLFVFDTENSFFVLDDRRKGWISKRHSFKEEVQGRGPIIIERMDKVRYRARRFFGGNDVWEYRFDMDQLNKTPSTPKEG